MKISNNAFTNLRTKYTPPPEEVEPGEKKDNAEKPAPELALDAAFKKLPGGLKLYVESLGKGELIEDGSQISVHYEGWLASDFTKFDSSLDKGRPFEYTHGEGMVIKGWETALEGVRAGTKLQLKIPARLAYGPTGMSGAGIPPNADLIFKLEVLSVKPPAAEPTPASGAVDRYV